MNDENKTASVSFTNKQLYQLIVPLALEQLLTILVGLADSVMVAWVGETAVSAVSLVDSVNNLLINVFIALATGGAVVAGRFLGQNDPQKANKAGNRLLVLVSFISLIVLAFMYASRLFWLDVVFGRVEPAVRANTNTYYLIVMLSIPFMALYSGASALFRTMSQSKISLRISFFMNLLNVLGNALLIYGFHMGVAGAAISTVFSRVAGALFILYLLKNPALTLHLGSPAGGKEARSMTRSILQVGVPGAMENGMFFLGRLILTSIVSTMGTSSIVANAIGNTMGLFHIFIAQAIALGMVTVTSQCIGAGDYTAARFYTRKLMKASYISQFIANALLIISIPLVNWLYQVSGTTARLAAIVMLIHSLASIFIYPSAFLLCSTLRAANDASYVMKVASTTMWLGRVFCGGFLGVKLGLGIVGVWLAQAFLDWGPRSIFFTHRYRSSVWETPAQESNLSKL